MRLVGASWMTVWSSLGAVAFIPVVISMLVTTVVVSLASTRLLAVIAPTGDQPSLSGLDVFGVGLRLTALVAIVTIGVTQLGLLSTRR